MRKYLWRLAALALAAAEVFACSDSKDVPATPVDGGDGDSRADCGPACTADTGGESPDVAAPQQDANATADAGADAGPGKGTITIAQNVPLPDAGDDAGTSTSASAQFTLGSSTFCSAAIVDGPCEVTSCTIFGGSTVTTVSAGEVKVTGASLPDGGVVLAVQDGGAYGATLGDAALFSGAESYGVRATGGVAPAFVVNDVPGVKGATLTAPVLSVNGIKAPITAPLSVTWTGGGAGNARFELVKFGLPIKLASCTFPASSGSGTVPVKILEALAAGGTSASFHVESSVKADAGNFDLTVTVLATRGERGFITLE